MVHFKTRESVFVQYESQLWKKRHKTIEEFTCEFEKIFPDFKNCELQFSVFSWPFILSVGEAYEEIQMELIDIQCDSTGKQKYCEV
jgi:hypothetical protein